MRSTTCRSRCAKASSCAFSVRRVAARRLCLWSMAGLHASDRRPDQARQGGHHPAASRDRDDLPGRQSAAVAQPAQERRVSVRAEAAPPGHGADRASARTRQSQGLRTQISARAFRRHAAARLDRQEPRGQSVGAPDGRAVRRARRFHPRRDEYADPGNLDGDRQDHRLRHPLDRGGDLPRRSRRGDVGAAWARIATIYDIDIPRPRSVEIQTQPDFIARVLEIKAKHRSRPSGGVGARQSPDAASRARRNSLETRRGQGAGRQDPEFNRKAAADEPGLCRG